MHIDIEPTPNPSTVKFLPGRAVMPDGTRDFASPEEAEASPLADALFGLGDVEGVFFGSDFVSVTKAPGSEWPVLKPDVLAVLLDHFASAAPLFHASAAPEEVTTFPIAPEDEDVVAQIAELIDTRVRPAVAADGGDIILRGFDKGTVYLAMQGACAGCPSSTMTLKQGVEQLLKYYVPEVTEVRAA